MDSGCCAICKENIAPGTGVSLTKKEAMALTEPAKKEEVKLRWKGVTRSIKIADASSVALAI